MKPRLNNALYVVGTRGFPNVQGGIERHCEELYTHLASAGEQVVVFTRSPYVATKDRWSIYAGVHLRRVWAPRSKHLEAITHTFLAIVLAYAWGGKRIHVHAVGPGLLIPLAKILGFKVVMTHHGFDYDRRKWSRVAKFMLRLGERLAMRYADLVITVSQQLAEYVRDRYHRDSVFLPNGVSMSYLRSLCQPAAQVLATHNLRPRHYLIAVARLVPEKGLDVLLDALAARDSLPPLVVVGDADHQDSYSRRVRSSADENTRFIGSLPHDQTLALIRDATAFVLPSYHEGLPIALLEALALGTPVIASDIVPNREIIGESTYGFLFRTGDAHDLRQKIEQVMHLDEKRREELGAMGRKRIQEQYNSDAISARFGELLALLL